MPTRAAYDRMDELEITLAGLLAQLRAILDDDVAQFNEMARARGVGGIITRREAPIP